MNHILEPNSSFDFTQLSCISPTTLNGGNYFIRILTKTQNPVYIQPPKCYTKQGFMKSAGKKLLCDLVFSHDNESFLNFLESLEGFCQTEIYNNRGKWFESALSMLDIENCFVSPTKSFKSGKFQIVRANVPIRLGKCNLKIFDEQEQCIECEKIVDNTMVATVLEIQGIRCSARSFQIELEIKQMMVLQPIEDLFERCIFMKKLDTPTDNTLITDNTLTADYTLTTDNTLITENTLITNKEEGEDESILIKKEADIESDFIMPIAKEEAKTDKNDAECLEEIFEVSLEIPSDETSVKLKNPNDVYYKMYKEAKTKAKLARDLAISSYLSARQIKNNYLGEEYFSDDNEMTIEENELRELVLDEK